MNHVNDCETGNRELVVSIKKSETIDLMDYTDSGVQGVNDSLMQCFYLTKTMLRTVRDSSLGLTGVFLEGISWVVIILTFPFSLLVCFKVYNIFNVVFTQYRGCDAFVTQGCDWVRAGRHLPPGPPQEGRLPRPGAPLWAALYRARGGGGHADIQDEGPAPGGDTSLLYILTNDWLSIIST